MQPYGFYVTYQALKHGRTSKIWWLHNLNITWQQYVMWSSLEVNQVYTKRNTLTDGNLIQKYS